MSIRDVRLIIDGHIVDLNQERVKLNSLVPWRKDATSQLSFTVESVFPVETDKWVNKPIELYVDRGIMPGEQFELIFLGNITRRVAGFHASGWAYGYEALGVDDLMTQWPIVSPFDGTGTITFNLAPTDTNYDPTYANLNLGRMILMLLEEPSTILHFRDTPVGKYWQDMADPLKSWKIDQRTRDDLLNSPYLAAMIAPKPISFSGDSLLQGIRNVLQSAAPNHSVWIQPVLESPTNAPSDPEKAYGILRFTDVAVRSTKMELDLAIDPVPEVQRNYATSFPRVVVRGGPNIKPMVLSLNANDISPNFASPWYANNTLAINDWKLTTWFDRTAAVITGRCWCRRPRSTSNPDEVTEFFPNATDPSQPIPNPNYIPTIYDPKLASPSWLLIDPDKPKANVPDYSWNAHVWGQNSNAYMGSIVVTRQSPTNAQWKQSDTRLITDNTNLTVGGTCYLTLKSDLPLTDYSNFTMTAQTWKGSVTWRKYQINAKLINGTSVAKRVQPAFPSPVPWINADGSVNSCTTTGVAQVFYTANATGNTTANTTSSMFVSFQTDRQTETIIFDRPLPMCFGDQASLAAGGANVSGQPTEIKVLLPVSYNALETQCPHDTPNTTNANYPIPNYQGTSFTVDGLTRTKYINNPDWVSESDTEMVWRWGNQQLSTICDTIVEGNAIVRRYDPVVGPGTWLAWRDDCWANGTFSFLESDIRGCRIDWHHGSTDSAMTTTYELSNKRDPYSDQSTMVYHPVLYPQPKPREADYSQVDSIYNPYGGMSESSKAFAEDITGKNATFDVHGMAANYDRLQAAGLGGTATFEEIAASTLMKQEDEAAKMNLNAVVAVDGGIEGDGQWHTAFGQYGKEDDQ